MGPLARLVNLAAAAAAIWGAARAPAAVTLYVSPAGNDKWDGRAAAKRGRSGPFATLQRAREEIRRLRKTDKLAGGAVVYVMPGTYWLSEPLELGLEDSGNQGAPVRWIARGNAILRAAKRLEGFRPFRGRIFRCNARAQGVEGRPWQLFFNGRRMTLARYPNPRPEDYPHDTWAHVLRPDPKDPYRAFIHTSDFKPRWLHPEDGRVQIFSGRDWAFRIVPIKAYDPASRRIELAGRTWLGIEPGDRYIVEGLFEELDSPGEWYMDPRTGEVYFWPPEDLARGEVAIPAARSVIILRQAHDIEIRGFTIEMCEGDAVRLEDCERCLIAACTVRNAGGWGIVISGGRETGARGNDIYWCGHGGISLRAGDRKTLTPAHCFADNNYIHHCAQIWRTYRPGISISGVGNTASHNLIHDMPHAGFLLGGNDNVVEYNIVHHVNLQSADTGGIYFCSRDFTQRGNIIRYNIFHHCGGYGKSSYYPPVRNGEVRFIYPTFTWGIYLDDPTCGTYVFGNILHHVPMCGLFTHGGKDNTWENNIVIDATGFRASMLSPRWSEWPSIFRKLDLYAPPGSIYRKRYPELNEIDREKPERMTGVKVLRNIFVFTVAGTKWLRERRAGFYARGNMILAYAIRMYRDDLVPEWFDYNCFYVEPGVEIRFRAHFVPEKPRELTWQQWRELGADRHSILANPGFYNLRKLDLRLRPGSAARRLGFKPIPISRTGPYRSRDRATWPIREAPGAARLGEWPDTEQTFTLAD